MGAVSTTPYTSQSISGYNSSPPSDDGAQTAANQVAWSKHKTKLSDPVKTLTESVNSALVTAFAKSVNTDAGERNQISGSLALDWATATIATDAITPTWSAALVGSESGATSDTLQVISATGVYQGALLTIKQRNSTEEIVIVHATSTAATATGANIYLTGNNNITLNDVNRTVQFSYDSGFASGWVPVGEAGGSGTTPTIQVFTATTSTYTKPSGLKAAWVRVVGSGGGGNSASTTIGAGGGGGGGYAEELLAAAAIAATETVTVATGGAATANGGTSSFGALLSGTGGTAGTSGAGGGAGGAAGSGSGGSFNISTGDGGTGSGVSGAGGQGGDTPLGGGGSGGVVAAGNGAAGNLYGGGGGGGGTNGTGGAGGAGADGIVVVVEFY